MSFTQEPLPFADNALEPHMSANTFSYHYGKHHVAYITNLNKLAEEKGLASESLENIILKASKDDSLSGLFNNAAQHYNHAFFWKCLKPNGGGEPKGALAEQIIKDFGSFEAFKDEFKTAGVTQFGSGWAWLVADSNNKLSVVKTANAGTPLTDGLKPLLVVDVWEHAYYLDFQNARPAFLSSFLDNLANWDFAESNFTK